VPVVGVVGARLAAQLLAGNPAATPEEATRRLLAVQAQDPRGFRLAIRARTTADTMADLEAALTERRSLVVTWLNRGTLHLVATEDYALLQSLTTPQLAVGNARRLRQEGVSPEQATRGVAVVADEVAAGPRTRPQLATALAAAGVPHLGQALVHVLFKAAIEGVVVRGPVIGAQHAYVPVDQWLGPAPDPLDRETALALLARRYLAGHGPADARDLAKWAGIPLRDAQAGLAAIADETEPVEELVALTGRRPEPQDAPPRLLGAYEPALLGWASRARITGEHDARVVSGGLFRPFALDGGRAVAIWRLERDAVRLEPFTALPRAVQDVLEQDGEALLRWLRRSELPPTR
jgi:Winged helix DNA-binding domain